MSYKTLAQLTDKINRDMELEGQDFIEPDEMTRYINEAIRDCESEIHSLYEDYFLTSTDFPIVLNQAEYDLPTDIYAMKVRSVFYNKNNQIYEIHRLQDWTKFREFAYNQLNNPSDTTTYGHIIVNRVAGSPKIMFTPTPTSVGATITMWYLRRANQLAVDADICDIPEYENFIYAYVKLQSVKKEIGHPLIPLYSEELKEERQKMVGTLAQKVPDNDNVIPADTTIYDEMS